MKKLMTSALMLALLSGCGVHPLVGTARVGSTATAQSKAGVEKGIHAMFRAAFEAADANSDKKLTLEEMPTAVPQPPVPGLPPVVISMEEVGQAKQAMLAQLDFNHDGVVTYREFARPDLQAQAIIFYRTEVAKVFAALDKNGDHILTANEVNGATFNGATFEMDFVDLNHNDKVTGSEFEDAFIRKFGQGPDPVDPAPGPAPVNPPAPAPDPAPAGDTPADQPA